MYEKLLKILLIEDNPGDARLIREYLAEEKKIDLEWAETLSRAFELLNDNEYDALLLDLSLPDSHGISTFERIIEDFPDIPITIMTGLDDKEFALEMVKNGAQDYLVKGQVTQELLTRVLVYSIERKKMEKYLKKENQILETTLESLLERVEKLQDGSSTPTPQVNDGISCEEGALLLFDLGQKEKVYKNLQNKFDERQPVLAITRMSPRHFKALIRRDIETVWLTTNHDADIVCVAPTDIAKLSMIITEFFKRAPNGCIFFEGGEYIVSNSGFPRFLKFIEFLNDRVASINGAVMIIMDLNILEPREASALKRECSFRKSTE